MANSEPTCVLKSNLGCCSGCRNKAKKKLQKIRGITRVEIDDEGMVRVWGVTDSSLLIKVIGRNARHEDAPEINPPSAVTKHSIFNIIGGCFFPSCSK